MKDNKRLTKACGLVIRQLRDEQRLTQEKFAELCDLDRTFLARIGIGLRRPSIDALFKIASGIGMRPSAIVQLIEERVSDQYSWDFGA